MSKYFKDYSELRREALKDPEVKREYDLLGPEYDAIGKIIELRIKNKMTQKQMAKKLGTKQSAISRLEKSLINPTLYSLAKIASIFGKKLVVDFK